MRLAPLVLAVGCSTDPLTSVHGDLAAGADVAIAATDGSAPDLAVAPVDAAPIDANLDAADIAMRADLATMDLTVKLDIAGCLGGYLNSDAGNACPIPCSPAIALVPDEGMFHVPFGTPVMYKHNPPASGLHWPNYATWGVHKEIVPREMWVHNLEHGAIVLLYNCPRPADGGVTDGGAKDGGAGDGGVVPVPDSCPNEIAQFEKIYAQHPIDNFWDLYFVTRILVTPDPYLPKRFAAVAWGWAYSFDQIDAKALQCFIGARYGRGPEDAP